MIRHILHGLRIAITGFLAGVAVFYAGQLLVWQFAPYKTATITVPIEVLNANNEIRPGEDILMLIIFDKQSDITPEVSRNIICNTGSVYDVEASSGARSRPTGKFVAEIEFKLTDRAKVGEICFFQFQNDYQVNPIRVIRRVWQSEPFTVTE